MPFIPVAILLELVGAGATAIFLAAALGVIPTYDEAESVVGVLERVLAADPRVDVLVVDDGSPDGTAKLVLDRAEGEPRAHLMERSGKQGLGAAYRAGFGWGLERGYDAVQVAYFHLVRIVMVIYMREPEHNFYPALTPSVRAALAFAAAGTIGIGLFPAATTRLAEPGRAPVPAQLQAG